MTDRTVVVGPWPGSVQAAGPARPSPPRPIPHRYRVGKHGPLVLMDCRECRIPWAPDVPVPRDRLCQQCRPDPEPTLFTPEALL